MKSIKNPYASLACFCLLFSITGELKADAVLETPVLETPVLENPVLAKGKAVYTVSGACGACHGAEGAGDGPASSTLNPKPANFQLGNYRLDTDGDGKAGTENDIYNIITKGAAAYGGNMMMVARGDLPEEDRRALAKYVLSLKK